MSKPIKLVETYSFHSAKDKLITRRIQHPDIDNCKFEKDISLSVLTVVTEDFNLDVSDNYLFHLIFYLFYLLN